jgi:glutamine amidotransferase
VHSLHGVPVDGDQVAATCEYGSTINAAFRKGNVFATQFHPEKSGEVGLRILRNFARIAAGIAS